MSLFSNIDFLPKTASQTIHRLKKIGILTYWDLLNYYPFRIQFYPKPQLISKVVVQVNNENLFTNEFKLSNQITIRGEITKILNVSTKNGRHVQKATLKDESGQMNLIWFNQYYLLSLIKPGSLIQISGKLDQIRGTRSVLVESYELLNNLSDVGIHTGGLIPVYSEKNGLSSRLIREKIYHLLKAYIDEIYDYLPQEIINKYQLIDLRHAISNIHTPIDEHNFELAKHRLAFDEIFILQLKSKIQREQRKRLKVKTQMVETNEIIDKLNQFEEELPFKLTHDQKIAVGELVLDLKKNEPMNRLLQGEVGSGKTVVALIAAYFSYLNGKKTLILAPTEILCQQHFTTLTKLLKNKLKILTLTGSNKTKSGDIKDADIIIGTTALIFKKKYPNVGLIVIDEQHKFGVVQRAKLKNIAQHPHLLTMTATPIPRTVLLTLYGQLDVSRIKELPQERIKTKSFLVPYDKREKAYEWIRKKITTEHIQVFIVCPLIDQSDVETMKDIKAVSREFETLKTQVFPKFRLSLLHGKMKSAEKKRVMTEFTQGTIDILVSTPVVEVGIDIPNAAIIIIESSDRYGLAQLHQLRGRVGRGSIQSYCLLFSENRNPTTQNRLKVFTSTVNGFELAEYDLKNRGAGEIFGTKQHGIPHLKIADFSDFDLVEKTQEAADYVMSRPSLIKSPEITKMLNNLSTDLYSQD
ncbi:hypothetical protein A3C23_03550 [Candidatus Roizmanbacteria bacterium RIFCSPHIGHO2_02_FULL_37_13b]|uniref:DNA helicase n=1 Tax=Candidatus Roizmanbacteria bacterium RIFCSPLOWO2_02_FULL_36_11 TaxID=1802071 RepID=A0A1F7JBY0_9BACT|nr:MAG: hypothetical protein A3C23_03550 [Candidatus Roizmanbacteria bacterium RIFCSPHIGHO2_02_FULL_37_13b]OGK53138.1 MAG: hypothetical protein A3H78_02025 [Candidatus Roizmanbacteria bacterium RIFCSPLOWO2_02_FULL_36_11]